MLLLHKKLFWKTKRGLELVSLPHFRHHFWTKIFLTLCYIFRPNFIVWLPLFFKISGNMFIVFFCVPAFVFLCFCVEIYLSLLSKLFSYITKTSGQRNKYPKNGKSFKIKQKSLFIIFKELSLKKNNTNFFGMWETPTLDKGL